MADYDQILNKLSELPTLPMIAVKVIELLNDPKSNSSEIANVIKQDQALSAKVLKLINSPYYGIQGGVADIQRACAFLGYNTIAQLVLSISVVDVFKSRPGVSFNLKEFWKHALAVAIGAENLARAAGFKKPEECFTAGLLHDIGKATLYALAPDILLNVSEHAIKKNISYFEAEIEMVETRHTILGGLLAQRWRLPIILATAIRTHHLNPIDRKKQLGDFSIPVAYVSIANKLAHNNNLGFSGDKSKRNIDDDELSSAKLSMSEIDEIVPEIISNVEKAKEFLKFV